MVIHGSDSITFEGVTGGGISFDTAMLLSMFRTTANNIAQVRKFCSHKYGLWQG